DTHRKSLKSRLAELTDARTEVPMQIGGERRWGASRADIRSPHRHELAIAEYAVGGAKDIDDAINAALAARKMWAATSYHERSALSTSPRSPATCPPRRCSWATQWCSSRPHRRCS